MDINELEKRLTDLERRFFPIEKVINSKYKSEVEENKRLDIERDGTNYNIKAVIETNKGKSTINFKVKAWTEKQALYLANENVIFPQMSRLQREGKIEWFKTISKQIIK